MFLNKNTFLIVLVGIVAIFQSCANVGQLKGGAKDTAPPQVVKEKSTPNLQTNFKKQPIILTFNEWVKLDDAFNQIVVSPPLNERPEVVLKGKKLLFEFPQDEVLRENATYTISFGDAIKDITESNPAKSLRFVFSTGNTIDSLVVTGKVVDAITGAPTEGVVLMLYDNLADTVVKKQKPFYFAKTDKEGFAKIENVRPGTFKVFALKDNDLNYLFNQETEKIGFPNDNLIVSAESKDFIKRDTATVKDSVQRKRDSLAIVQSALQIRLFEPYKTLKITSRETDKFGVVKLTFNKTAATAKVTFDDVKQNAFTEVAKDSLLIWYNAADETPWNVYFNGEMANDTVRVRPRGKADFLKRGKLIPLSTVSSIYKKANKPIEIAFNYPIANINNELFKLSDSSKNAVVLNVKIDSVSKRKIILEAEWKEGQPYSLTVLPAALTDIFGFKNDTLISKINVSTKKDFGDIIVKLNGLDKSKSYVCQVLNGTGNIEGEFFVDNSATFEKRVESLSPDQYSINVIEDLNKNRMWDTGDYDKKSQPERIFSKKSEQALRANWDLEIEATVVF